MRSIRNFFITFGISLVVFGLIGFIIWNRLVPDIPDEKNNVKPPIINNEEIVPDNGDKVIATDGFTALLCCYDDTLGSADAIVLLNVNKENKKFAVCSIPVYLKINVGTETIKKEEYLGDLLVRRGRNYFLDKVEAITGLPIDYHAFMSSADFVNVINEIGGIEYNVPERMYYQNKEGMVLVDLQAGLTRLNGEKALQLVRYRSYDIEAGKTDDGDEERRSVQCDFLYKLMSSFLKPDNRDSIDGIVKNALDLLVRGDTNFTVSTFIRHKDMLLDFSEYSHDIINYPISSTKLVTLSNDEVIAVHTPNIKEAVENVFIKYRTVRPD